MPGKQLHVSVSLAVLLIAGVVLAPAGGAQSSTLPPGTTAPSAETTAPQSKTAENPLNDAETKLAAGDYAGAEALLQPYLSAHTEDARGWFDLGYAQEASAASDASGNEAAAEASYRKAIAANPQQFEATAALGLLLAKQGHRDEARALLKKAQSLTPNPPDPAARAQADRALARLLVDTDPDGASAALLDALRESPETADDSLLAGEIATKDGNTDAAADAYGRVIAQTPEGSTLQAQATAGLAHLLIAAKRYPEAEAVLRKGIAANPHDTAMQAQLADVLAQEGKPQDAIAALESVHTAQPDDDAVTGMLADLYTQSGDAAKAEPLYKLLLQKHPHDPGLLASDGDALVRTGKFADAVTVLQEAVRLDPKNGNAASSLAFAASQTHQPELVLQALAIRSKVMSETPATYFLAATAYDSLHQPEQAAEMYRQFLAVAGNGFPNEVWQARHRLIALKK
jgi:tetratricopeptide (TPR) repeat protein